MTYDPKKYKVLNWKHWGALFWIINPGTAILELILGMRAPKIALEDITSDKPRFERSYIPCPHCNTLHDSRTWSNQNNTGFRNWFGLYCSNCGEVIPCMWSITSLVLLFITYPIWGWFKDSMKKRWLEKQPSRYKDFDVQNTYNPFDDKSWIFSSLSFGWIMFMLMSIVIPFLQGHTLTLKTLGPQFIIWTIGGFVYGFIMKLYVQAKSNKQKNINNTKSS